ncbi:MAG: hypothetical protein JSS49_26920 [Planctomycetes bacterium]|nr:hypothetical protein [Planctomycetota bacterium]
MYAFYLSLVLMGQVEIGVPPAPAAEVPAAVATDSAESMRNWLLARLVIDSGFDEQKSSEARRLLDTMNTAQLTTLVTAYKERMAKPAPAAAPQLPVADKSVSTDPVQQQAMDQAKLNLQQAEAYRDYLKREYDRRILQGHMTQNLVYQNILNNQMMMYRTNGPYTYGAFGMGPYGIGGLGYGVLNYGGFGYGAPMYGGGFY